MSRKLIVLGIIVGLWCYSGWCNYHYNLGRLTAQFPDQNHEGFARFSAAVGPIAYLADFVDGDHRVWLDKPYTCQQRWDEFKKNAEILGKGYFVHYGGNYTCNVGELHD